MERSVRRATTWLIRAQLPSGAIAVGKRNHVAQTSLAILALAASGVQPTGDDLQSRSMLKALQFILKPEHITDEGYFGKHDGSRMYGHGITMVMLGEMMGMVEDPALDRLIHQRLKQGTGLILKAQQVDKHPEALGGWRYLPDAQDADISVTVWQLMALRSANSAGLDVPGEAIAAGIKFVESCYASPRNANGMPLRLNVGIGYTAESTKYMSSSTTSMGLLALQLMGEKDSPFLRGGLSWLERNPPEFGFKWHYYGLYYYASAMDQVGGARAERAHRHVEKMLLSEQEPDGCWDPSSTHERYGGKVYATACAVLALAVRNHYLFIYER